MNLFKEKTLIEQSDEPVRKMLKTWHELCIKKVGFDIEVLVGNVLTPIFSPVFKLVSKPFLN